MKGQKPEPEGRRGCGEVKIRREGEGKPVIKNTGTQTMPMPTRQGRDASVVGASQTATHLSLGVGLQPEQTAHLQGFRLDDSGPYEVFRVGVHIVQESRAKPQELGREKGSHQRAPDPAATRQ